MPTKTPTATAAAPTSVEEHQVALAALEAEQRQLPAGINTARRDGDTAEWMRLVQRETELPAEIDAARVRLLRAQLEDAWAAAERCADRENTAHAEVTAAQAAKDEYAQSTPPRNRTATEMVEISMNAAGLRDAYTTTVAAHAEARHATAVALCEVDTIEDAIETATGQRPRGGDGLRAPIPRLAVNFIAYDPREYEPAGGHPGTRQGATRHTFYAGTIPPRWAAHEITAPDAWEEAAA